MWTFLTLIGKSKIILRHSWRLVPNCHTENLPELTKLHNKKLMNYRRESNAEHAWRLALMVMLWSDNLDIQNKVDKDKAMKIALIHDLGEILSGDIPVHQQTPQVKTMKRQAETAAMDTLMKELGTSKESQEIYQLWIEYEEQKTLEAKFVKALDKIEAFLQHNEDPLETWEPQEKRMYFQTKWLEPYCRYDSFLTKMCTEVLESGIEKLKKAAIDIKQLQKEAAAEEVQWELKVMTNQKVHT